MSDPQTIYIPITGDVSIKHELNWEITHILTRLLDLQQSSIHASLDAKATEVWMHIFKANSPGLSSDGEIRKAAELADVAVELFCQRFLRVQK